MFPFSRKDAGFRIQPNAAFRSELILTFQLLGKSQMFHRLAQRLPPFRIKNYLVGT